jgi:DNA (cytosine-5)-methyltransferase 1
MSAKPRLLDLFCCAGGAARGYQRAGFDVWGVDIARQPRYVGDHFTQGDAVQVVAQFLLDNGYYRFDAIHASPPCQAHSDLQKQSKRSYRDWIPEVRTLLEASHLPYVIENVEGAPLLDPITLCGTQFPGLRVLRHRLFESNLPLVAPSHHPRHPLVFTRDKRKAHYGRLDPGHLVRAGDRRRQLLNRQRPRRDGHRLDDHTDPCPDGCNDGVPVPRLRATVALLSPDEITPTAQRLLLRLCDEHQPANTP